MELTGSYIYIPVSDLQRAAIWYIENLGFKIVKEDSIYLELRSEHGIRIMLIPKENNINSHMNYSNGVQASYGFTVTDLDTIYQQFIEKGIKVGKISNYEGRSFGFHDPDGNVIELWCEYQ
jgi:catechol-2,3-dioxygenase